MWELFESGASSELRYGRQRIPDCFLQSMEHRGPAWAGPMVMRLTLVYYGPMASHSSIGSVPVMGVVAYKTEFGPGRIVYDALGFGHRMGSAKVKSTVEVETTDFIWEPVDTGATYL